MKILFISTPHTTDAIEAPAKLILEGFEEIGHETTHINASKNENRNELIKLIKNNEYDLIFTLNIGALLLRSNFKKIFKIIKCPVAIFLLDHPTYHMQNLTEVLPKIKQKVYSLTPDELHNEHLKKYIHNNKLRNASTIFFPWAAPSKKNDYEQDNKIYDLICFCSLDAEIERKTAMQTFIEKFKDLYSKEYFENFFKNILHEDLKTPLEQHLKSATKINFDLNSPSICKIFSEFDSLTKRIRRNHYGLQIANISKELNLKLCVCGSGWENLLENKNNFTILGNINYMDQFSLYQKSKIMINLDPNWTNGIHDRVFNALSCNISVITNQSKYKLKDNLPSEKIDFYNNLNDIPQKVTNMIEKTKSKNNSNVILQNENWTSRAESLTKEIFKNI